MVNFNERRFDAVIYPTGICNLNCRYCTIDKNPALKDIDNELGKSFEGDYYFNRIKEYFPRRDQLKRLETWGGEPFIHMDRVHHLVHQLIDYYPYFNTMFSSTNFSYDTWLDQFMGLMNCFADYPYREFNYCLQLSVDGPTEINDGNRGRGVTAKCIENFDKLINLIKEGKFPQNVNLLISLKGTWDADCRRKLNSKEKLIEFFQFYENNYIDKIAELDNPKQFPVPLCIPNTAVPAPTTQEDGKIFCELVKKCREIEKENFTEHYFKYYEVITPFNGPVNTSCSLCGEMYGCNSGQGLVGFLPFNLVSACHEGFTLMVDQYKEFAKNRSDKDLTVSLNHFFELQTVPMCLTDEQYAEHERKMSYINITSPVETASTIPMIMALAMSGLIDKKYIDEEKALFAAQCVMGLTTYCIKAHYSVTGSFLLQPTDLYILLLNGALDYILEDN